MSFLDVCINASHDLVDGLKFLVDVFAYLVAICYKRFNAIRVEGLNSLSCRTTIAFCGLACFAETSFPQSLPHLLLNLGDKDEEQDEFEKSLNHH